MREILFRGKRVDNGEWVEGFYVLDPQANEDEESQIYYTNKHPCGHALVPFAVIPETVGQYTGLKDNNGNKIFEGDVVKDKFEEIGVVEFNTEDVASCGCCYEYFTGTGFRAENICLHSCEVIGNIHDNPELLKDGE